MRASVSRWISRWRHWEFWPFWVFYFPVIPYFIYQAIKCRSFFFFTAANPGIEFGGMLGERKSDVFQLIPRQFYPTTLLIQNREQLLDSASELGYPCIVKPDIGERGVGVEVIRTPEQLLAYRQKMPVDFLLQTYVDYPLELGVFYVRMPREEKGCITSIVKKDFLTVVGDGQQSVRQLLDAELRAQLQLDFSHDRFSELMERIPQKDETVVVEPVGNHCRGTKFRDYNHAITPELTEAFDQLSRQIEGLNYGRFDIKCKSMEALERLEDFAILELNGAGAEPAHVYEPGRALWKAYRDIFSHFSLMGKVSRAHRKRGVKYWSVQKGVKKLLDIRNYNRLLRSV